MEWYFYPLIVAAGTLSGFINTLAGSGSLVTLPLLISLGLPPTVANGTNRVAIIFQNIVGTSSFYQRKMLDLRGVLWLGIPAVFGSVIGAQIAVTLDEAIMKQVIGVVMVAMLIVILVRPNRWLRGELEDIRGHFNWKQVVIFFLIGIYGGFIQAGVGVFLLAGLVLGVGYDLVRANAVKLGIALFFTVFALGIFMANGKVDWVIGLVLSLGNMLGAWLGARVAIQKGAVWVRRLLIAVVAVSAANLLGIFKLLDNLL